MSYRKLIVLGVFLVSCMGFSGCGEKAPDGFPATVPFSVKVMKDGAPVVEANVRLVSSGGHSLAVSGKTNSSGVAQMSTISGSYSRKGAPEGKYTVLVDKPLIVDTSDFGPPPSDRAGQIAWDKKMQDHMKKMTPEVPEIFGKSDTSTLSTEVAKGKTEETVDVTP